MSRPPRPGHVAQTGGRPDWHALAACHGLPHLMDPPCPTAEQQAAAIALCRTCPVIGDCLAWGLSLRDDPGGIIGGTTEGERRTWRRRQRPRAEPPPTLAGRRELAARRRLRFADLRAAGVTVHDAARRLGISPRQADRYEARRKAGLPSTVSTAPVEDVM